MTSAGYTQPLSLGTQARMAAVLARRTYTAPVGDWLAKELEFLTANGWSGADKEVRRIIAAVQADARRFGIAEDAA
jgi:hypothetical protein